MFNICVYLRSSVDLINCFLAVFGQFGEHADIVAGFANEEVFLLLRHTVCDLNCQSDNNLPVYI